MVHPDSVVRWQHESLLEPAVKEARNKRVIADHPPVRTLIRTLVEANPLWRALRIHGELLKLGIAANVIYID